MTDDGSNPPSWDEMRDAHSRAAPEHADKIRARDVVVQRWCAERGKSVDDVTIDDLVAIRALPEWQNASQ